MVTAVWVSRAPDGQARFESYAGAGSLPKDGPAAGGVLLTNDPEALGERVDGAAAEPAVCVLDVTELFRFAEPSSPAETVPQLLASVTGTPPGAAALWQLWEAISQRLCGMPLWALETIELLLREKGDVSMARCFGWFAETVRRRGKACGAWRDSFPAVALRQFPRQVPSHADCSPLNEDAVMALLQPGGPLSRLMPGYEPRAGQVDMLRRVVQSFNEARHLLVEAGTGVGKSVAYLLPAVLWAKLNDVPVIISTNTRNLQSQLLDKDLPLVRQVVEQAGVGVTSEDRAVRFALIKGRSNYLCLRRLGGLLEHGQFEMDRAEMRLFARAVAWVVQTQTGDMDELGGGCGMDEGFLTHLASLGEECSGRGCRYYRRCFLQKARDNSLQAHVIIANHALVFAEMSTPGVALPAAGQIVFDEAHNLEEAATRHFSIEVSSARLQTQLRRLTRGGGRHAGGVLDVLRRQVELGALGGAADRRKALLRQIRHVSAAIEHVRDAGLVLFRASHGLLVDGKEPRRFQRAGDGPTPDFFGTSGADHGKGRGQGTLPLTEEQRTVWEGVLHAAQAFRAGVAQADTALQALATDLRKSGEGELALHEDQAVDLEAGAAQLRTFAMDLDFVLAGSDDAHVFWVQRARVREALGDLWAAPLQIGPRLAKELYANWSSVVFCSATLRVGNVFDFVAGRLGVDQIPPDRLMTCVAASPFCYAEQCAVLAPTFLPEPGADGMVYAEQLSALMLDVFVLTRGRALGLFTSYEMMQRCARLLRTPLAEEGIRLLVQGENGSRDQITRIFRGGGACVLLGTHSFWEGVDVVGDALSCVVMARLPFAAVGEPVHEARCEQVQRAGGHGFLHFSLPTAVIRFRQGFGRLIRHRTDRGVVIVADPRLVTRNYASRFHRSLPCKVEVVAEREALLARVQSVLG
ncbi:MAG: helicase C-terminal domain-containing protein [bacterium]